jgi:hypothetical protein
MLYDTPLDCALLFGVDTNGQYRSIDEIDWLGVPVPTHFGRLKAALLPPMDEFGKNFKPQFNPRTMKN